MTFKELKDILSYTTLFDLSIKKDDKAVAIFINNGIKDLQSRFFLNPRASTIILNSDIIPLPTDFNRFISLQYKDNNEFVKFNVTETYNELEYKLIHTFDSLLVLGNIPNKTIDIVYESDIPLIDTSKDDYDNQVVNIPTTFINALTLYVGFVAHASMDSNIKAENNTYYMRYIAECKRLAATYSILESNSLDTDYVNPITNI